MMSIVRASRRCSYGGIKSAVLLTMLILTACTSNGVILFAPNLSKQDKSELVNHLFETGIKVAVVDANPPKNLNVNAIITPGIVKDPDAINTLKSALMTAGYKIDATYNGAKEFNHHYTKGNIGVYILDVSLAENKKPKSTSGEQ